MLLAIPLTAEMLSKEPKRCKGEPQVCVKRFEEKIKKFNEGSAVRLIDALRKQSIDHIETEKPAGGNVVAGQNKRKYA